MPAMLTLPPAVASIVPSLKTPSEPVVAVTPLLSPVMLMAVPEVAADLILLLVETLTAWPKSVAVIVPVDRPVMVRVPAPLSIRLPTPPNSLMKMP